MADIAEITERAIDQAMLVVQAALDALDVPKPSREELRARFQGVLDAPDDATYEALRTSFGKDFGEQSWAREWELALRAREQKNGRA